MLARTPKSSGALALDEDWVYWIDQVHGLARVSKRAGGTVHSLALPSGGIECCGLVALDAADVYWTVGAESTYAGLLRTHKDAGRGLASEESAVAVDRAQPACLAVDANALYWMRLQRADAGALGGAAVRSPKGGGAPKVLAEVASPGFGCVALDASHVYWASVNEFTGEGAIRAMPKAGGPAKTVAAVTGPALYIQADQENVYWAEGAMMRAPKAGGGPARPLAHPETCHYVTGTALDDQYVYFTCAGVGPREDSGTVWRVAKTGGAPILLADHQLHPSSIATDSELVYWSCRGSERKSFSDGAVVRLAKDAVAPSAPTPP